MFSVTTGDAGAGGRVSMAEADVGVEVGRSRLHVRDCVQEGIWEDLPV
jgi:hypothetical protein